ncbi:hypothetical protein AAH678_08240 [Sodalis endosymbiont of Spalangia cameroni]|uniref:hypothetical protein n=1 Tax=Sodalis praecaptivus TaxID=1239307 RepID=UPI0031FA0A68
MELTYSSVSGQENSFAGLPPDRETRRGLNNAMKKCNSIQNSPDTFLQSKDLKDRSADVIKAFFKQTIAAQSYTEMFSKGANFEKLGIAMATPSARRASLHALQHLNNVSKSYLTKIKKQTQNLTSQEKALLSKVIDTTFHFRHQSNSNLVDGAGTLNIMSLNKLRSDKIRMATNTHSDDIKCINNQDFVFFGVELRV